MDNEDYGIITLACIEAGEELNSELLKSMVGFRREYLAQSGVGIELLKAYKNSLNMLKNMLNVSPQRHELLLKMYDTVCGMERLIEQGQFEEATGLFITEVLKLEKNGSKRV